MLPSERTVALFAMVNVLGGSMNLLHGSISLLIVLVTCLPAFSAVIEKNPFCIYRNDKSQIDYYLEKVDPNVHSKDLLLVLQGSDCNSVTNVKAVHKLRKVYAIADLLTIEKYGITENLPYSELAEREDCPQEYIEKDNPEQRVSDIDSVVECLITEYKYARVIVIGGSEGSLVANLLSSKVPYVSATVLFGGGGQYFKDNVIHSMKFMYNSEDETEKNIKGFNQFIDYILSSGPFPLAMSNHGYSWWRSMLSIDQLKTLESIKTPVLIIQGTDDHSASSEKANEMYNTLIRKGKTNIMFKQYDGYNHSLNLSVNDGSSEKVLVYIENWLDTVL